MRASIEPSKAYGTVVAPPSKSVAHRLLIAAALAEGESEIQNIPDCEDVRATIGALSSLGVKIERFADSVKRSFVSEYANGRTPNPCVICNSEIKFKLLVVFIILTFWR